MNIIEWDIDKGYSAFIVAYYYRHRHLHGTLNEQGNLIRMLRVPGFFFNRQHGFFFSLEHII